MGTVSKAIIIGFVGQNPDIRTTQGGGKVASLSVATSDVWRDKATNERKERTQWHRVVVFNENIAKVVEQYVKKGACLYIEGSMRSRKWNDKQGIERWVTEVVLGPFNATLTMLDRREAGPPPADNPDAYGTGGEASDKPPYNDEIPF